MLQINPFLSTGIKKLNKLCLLNMGTPLHLSTYISMTASLVVGGSSCYSPHKWGFLLQRTNNSPAVVERSQRSRNMCRTTTVSNSVHSLNVILPD